MTLRLWSRLFTPQGDDRIDSGRAPRRHVAGGDRDNQNDGGSATESLGIHGAEPEQQASHPFSSREGSRYSNSDTGKDKIE